MHTLPRLASVPFDPSKLHEVRSELGLSQEALARQINCSTITVQGWERGVRSPSRKMLKRLAKATGRSEEFFLAEAAA